MKPSERIEFNTFITGLLTHYGEQVTTFSLESYWLGLEECDFESVKKACVAHMRDPDGGRFCPKVAHLMRHISGTRPDRAKLAWSKVLRAMTEHGATRDVCFDDPLIHLAVQDLGGWIKLCRTETDELSYTEHRFCTSYGAHSETKPAEWPAMLVGEYGSQTNRAELQKRGLPLPQPVFVGDRAKCEQVLLGGDMRQAPPAIERAVSAAIRQIGQSVKQAA